LGVVTTQQFYAEICRITGFRASLAEFSECFADIFVPIEPMVQLQATLRQRGLPAYIFSNTNELAVEHIRRSFPFYANFDGYILSYQHGAMKPDARLYEIVERQSARRGAEILYLDDRPENIAAGAARGWQVILHQTPEKSLAAIQKLGLLNHESS
jgi:HAD superfamily hydrolase (TIGR01509 family)